MYVARPHDGTRRIKTKFSFRVFAPCCCNCRQNVDSAADFQVHTWFIEITIVPNIGMHACVCGCAPKGIDN